VITAAPSLNLFQ